MLLQHANRPVMGNRTFNYSLQSTSLVVSVAEYHDFFRIHHGPHTYCQRMFRHLVDVVIKEPTISNDSVTGEGLDTSTRCK